MNAMIKLGKLIPIVVISGFAFCANAFAQGWEYREVTDKFTDKRHVIATNGVVPAAGQAPIKVSFECRHNKEFVFSVDTGHRLGAKRENFKFYYRAAGKKTEKIRMATFTNSNTGGLNKIKAVEIANDFLNADSLIVRAVSADNDEYDAEISLAGAYEPIVKAVVACGMSISG